MMLIDLGHIQSSAGHRGADNLPPKAVAHKSFVRVGDSRFHRTGAGSIVSKCGPLLAQQASSSSSSDARLAKAGPVSNRRSAAVGTSGRASREASTFMPISFSSM